MAPHGSITTLSGIRFWPLLPNPGDILVEDIAHALAHQCRFGGHASKFYSVAEHSVHVSELCPVQDALWGLLHDASEAYLIDLPRPLKLLPEFAPYREAERQLQRAVAARFGLPEDQPASVTEADDTYAVDRSSFTPRLDAGGGYPGDAPSIRDHGATAAGSGN
jgi:hypothetical protein